MDEVKDDLERHISYFPSGFDVKVPVSLYAEIRDFLWKNNKFYDFLEIIELAKEAEKCGCKEQQEAKKEKHGI